MLKGSDEPTSASSKKNLSCHGDALQISMANRYPDSVYSLSSQM